MKFVSQGFVDAGGAFLAERNIVNPMPLSHPKFYVEFDQMVVICFWADTDSEKNERTVYAFDRGGNLLWQIESLRNSSSDSRLTGYDPYVTVGYSTKDGTLLVSTFGEDYAVVDLQTGAVTYCGGRFSLPK